MPWWGVLVGSRQGKEDVTHLSRSADGSRLGVGDSTMPVFEKRRLEPALAVLKIRSNCAEISDFPDMAEPRT